MCILNNEVGLFNKKCCSKCLFYSHNDVRGDLCSFPTEPLPLNYISALDCDKDIFLYTIYNDPCIYFKDKEWVLSCYRKLICEDIKSSH